MSLHLPVFKSAGAAVFAFVLVLLAHSCHLPEDSPPEDGYLFLLLLISCILFICFYCFYKI